MIDFSEAKFFSPRWHRRVRLLQRGLAAECDRELFTALHRHAASKLALDRLTEESFVSLQENAETSIDELKGLYRPWQFDPKSKEEREKEEYKGLRKGWQKFFGSMDDPEVAGRVAELRAALLRKKAEEAPAPGAPMQAAGIFNAESAQQLSNMQALGGSG